MRFQPADNPFRSEGGWFKGAIHIHTDRSDGAVSPAQALAAYKARGFDFLVFGDHNRITVVEDPDGEVLVLPGAEWAARFGDDPAGMHFMAVGMQPGREQTLAGLIDDPYAMARALRGMCEFLVLAHPYWSRLTPERILRTEGIDALEVYNHGCEVEDALGRAAYVWDQLLVRGRRCWGIAVDDAHWRRRDDRFGGWVLVRAARRAAEDLLGALKAGRFYSTCGPEILDVEFTAPRRVRVRSSPVRSILFRSSAALGDGLHSVGEGTIVQAEHELPPGAGFVRIELSDAVGRKAWTNPFELPG